MSRAPRLPFGAPRQPRNNAEDRLQMALVQHLLLRRKPGWLFFSVPNGGNLGARSLKRLTAMGMLNGAPDLVLIGPPDGRAFGLELKAKGRIPSENGTQTEEQMAVEIAWKRAGGDYRVATGMDEALAVLTHWGALKADRSASLRAPSLFEGVAA